MYFSHEKKRIYMLIIARLFLYLSNYTLWWLERENEGILNNRKHGLYVLCTWIDLQEIVTCWYKIEIWIRPRHWNGVNILCASWLSRKLLFLITHIFCIRHKKGYYDMNEQGWPNYCQNKQWKHFIKRDGRW